MRQRLFNIVVALSLLLCVAVCVLWVRSYWLSDELDWRCKGGWRSVRSAQGRVEVRLTLADWSNLPADTFGLKYVRDHAAPPFNSLILLNPDEDDTDISWEWGSFAWHEKRKARGGGHAHGVVPFWCIAAATALLPLGWTTMRWRSRGRKRPGLCHADNDDISATPDRCP